MRSDRFTFKSQEALAGAVRIAQARGNPQVKPEHLLAALLEDTDGIAVAILRKLGADQAALTNQLDQSLATLPTIKGATAEAPPISSELSAVLNTADQEARSRDDDYVSTEHLLLAISAHPGSAGDALRSVGAEHQTVADALAEVRGSHRVQNQNPEDMLQALERYGRDLTAEAAEGKLDPVIGRDAVIRRVIQILSRAQEQPRADRRAGCRQDRRRRGPRPAHRLRRHPRALRDRRVISLDLGRCSPARSTAESSRTA